MAKRNIIFKALITSEAVCFHWQKCAKSQDDIRSQK